MRISFLHRVFDLIAPRSCSVCERRLAPEEEYICARCRLHLPRTDHLLHPYDNELAKVFWGRVKSIEKAVAYLYHQAGSQSSYPIYTMKYFHRPEIGRHLGQVMAKEMSAAAFFDDIDLIIPVPLAPNRQRERGYNQSEMIARGIAEVCGKPLVIDALRRRNFTESQTSKDRWERNENVAHVFSLHHCDKLCCTHILLVDDIVTTGATICACANLLEQVEGVKISVAAVGTAQQPLPLQL